MPKRFTATEKWLDPWFCGLSLVDRLFWLYLLDNCDHAGFWQVNTLLVQTYFPGYTLDTEKFKGRIDVLSPDKWHLRKFIEFQYGTLNPKSKPHSSVLKRLKKEGVSKGLVKSSSTIKDKDKDKDKVKDKAKVNEVKPAFDFEAIWNRYPKRIDRKAAEKHFKASVITEVDYKAINRALDNYKQYIHDKKIEEQFIKQGSTWFNNWRDWIDYGGSHGTNGGTGISEYAAIAKRARETMGVREPITNPRALPARVRDMPDVPDQTTTSDGTRLRGDVEALEILRAGGFEIKPAGS